MWMGNISIHWLGGGRGRNYATMHLHLLGAHLKSFLRKTKLTWTDKLRIKVSHEDGRFNLLFNIHCVLLASDANYESHLQYLSEDSRETLSEPCHQYSHFQEQQAQQRHSQSVTSVIINPVAVEDFRSRVEGRVVVEGSGRERGAMNSSGSGSGGEGGGKFIVPGLFCFPPFL